MAPGADGARDLFRSSQIPLYVRTIEGTTRMRLGRSNRSPFRRGLVTEIDDPAHAPSASMAEATELARQRPFRVPKEMALQHTAARPPL